MIQPLKVKLRKNYLESEYQESIRNLSLLEDSARKGNLNDLELYIQEWNSYSKDNHLSLVHLFDILNEYSNSYHAKYQEDKLLSLLENNVVPRVKNIKSGVHYIYDFLYENHLPMYNIMVKCNEMFTYDRIIKNQRIFDERCDFNQDFDDIVIDICHCVNESNVSNDDKFAISLENSLYTSLLLNQNDISEDYIESLVETFFIIENNKLYDYDAINIIHEDNDEDEVFKNVVCAGVLTGMQATSLTTKDAMNYVRYDAIRDYEREHGLKPIEYLDMQYSKDIMQYIQNDYEESYDRTEFIDTKINGINYKYLAIYKDGKLSRLCILYRKKGDLVLLPVYAPLQLARPTIISNGIVKSLYEETIEVIYEKKAPKPKKKEKSKGSPIKDSAKKLKQELSKINFKDSKGAQKLKELVKKVVLPSNQYLTRDLASIFDVIRVGCTFGSFVLNPYLGIITFITMYIMKMHLSQKEKDKVIKEYDKEINRLEKKIDNCKNEKTKENYKKTLNRVEEDKRKLEDFYDRYYVDQDEERDIDDMMFDESGDIVLNELTFLNKLKLAKQNLKKNMVKLSDKERVVSNQLDHAYDKFIYGIEKNMANKNREAVIKGSVIPSFSALIKLALVSGAASIVSPVLAAITVFGGIAASKRATANERKYILDEIDIQLKVVDKKLQLAESNNDMKAYEQLLRIKRQLESEKHRIIYKKRRPVIATKYN